MQLFQSPWLRSATSHSSRPATRRVGTARRVAALLQLESARKQPFDLDPPPAVFVMADNAPDAESMAA